MAHLVTDGTAIDPRMEISRRGQRTRRPLPSKAADPRSPERDSATNESRWGAVRKLANGVFMTGEVLGHSKDGVKPKSDSGRTLGRQPLTSHILQRDKTLKISPSRDNPSVDIGKQLGQFRAKNNLTQDEVAAELGVSAGAVHRWEVGERKPRGRNIRKIEKLIASRSEKAPYDAASIIRRIDELLATFSEADQAHVLATVLRVAEGRHAERGTRPSPPKKDRRPG